MAPRKIYINPLSLPKHLRLSKKDCEKIIRNKITKIRNYFKKSGWKRALIGVSGGIDSALSAILTSKALGAKNVYFIRMPYIGISSKESLILAEKLARNLKLKKENLLTIPINKQVDLSWKILKKIKNGREKLRRGNLMARERMKILFDLSTAIGALVVGTEDKSEERLGYFTIGGDHTSGIEPIIDLYKCQAYQVIDHFKEIPDEILMRTPSPEFWENHTDEGEIGVSYLEVDTIISAIEDLKLKPKQIEKRFKIKKAKINLTLKRLKKAKGKRFLPYILNQRITSIALFVPR